MKLKWLSKFLDIILLVVPIVVFYISNSNAEERTKYYCVQIISSLKFNTAERIWKRLESEADVRIEKIGKFYTIRVGYFKNLKKAKEELKKLKGKYGFQDSFARTCFYNIKTILEIKNKTINSQKREFKKYKINEETNEVKVTKKRKVIQKVESEREDKYYLYIQRAKICISKKDCSLAVKYLKKAIQQNPKNPKTYVYLGYAYLHLKKFEDALKAFQKALLIDPYYTEGYEALGYLYLKLNNPKAALIFLEKAYELKPNNVYYATNYAISLMEVKDYSNAERVFSTIKSKFPFIPEIYFNEALLYIKEKNWNKAKKNLEMFISLTQNIKEYQPYIRKAKQLINTIRRIRKRNEKRLYSN